MRACVGGCRVGSMTNMDSTDVAIVATSKQEYPLRRGREALEGGRVAEGRGEKDQPAGACSCARVGRVSRDSHSPLGKSSSVSLSSEMIQCAITIGKHMQEMERVCNA
ncbi:unnamed protein product, partial [Hapterophycus canaliculatus]